MQTMVIFGVGSSLVVDLEEGLGRAGHPIAAAVSNVPGEVYLMDDGPVIQCGEVTPELTALPYLVPLFQSANRRQAVEDAEGLGFTTAGTFIDPSAVASGSVTVEPGVWVNAGVTLGAACRFGAFVLINRGANIGHHARIGEFGSVGPGAVFGGEVTVGPGATLGAGAVVLPGVTIGADATVGAGAVVTSDVPDRSVVVGNPARPIRGDLDQG